MEDPKIYYCKDTIIGKWEGYIGCEVGTFVFSINKEGELEGYFIIKIRSNYTYATGKIGFYNEEKKTKLDQLQIKENTIIFQTHNRNSFSGKIVNNKCFGPCINYKGRNFAMNIESWGMYR